MLDFHQGTLRLHGADFDSIERLDDERLDDAIEWVHDDREACFRCDAMHWAAAVATLQRTLNDSFESLAGEGNRTPITILDRRPFALRPDQIEAADAVEDGGGCGLVVMPTGTGKSAVALELAIRRQRPFLVVVPIRDLMYQWHDVIRESTGIDAGLIGDGVHRVSPISVATYDSATIHMHRIGDKFGLIIFDEVHHLPTQWRADAARMSTANWRVGLTATRPADVARIRMLENLVGPIVYQQQIADASGRTLADYTVRRIAVRMEDSEAAEYRRLGSQIAQYVADQKDIDSAFVWEDANRLMGRVEDEPERSAAAQVALRAFRAKRKIEEQAAGKFRVLEDLFRLHAGQPVIVFTGSNVMARRVSMRFLVPCLLSHCAKAERREWLSGFRDGRYPVLVANRVLDEGVDLPEVKVAIVLGGMASQRQAIQRLGRVLRRGTAGQDAVLYEVVTAETNEVQRSRDRRRNDAYQKK